MPKRLVLQTVIMYREGERVVPDVGKPFDFTNEELKSINGLNPDALGHIINKDEETKTGDTITLADHEALVQKARDEAVEQFKLQQAGNIKESADVLNANPDGSAVDPAKTDKNAGTKADKKAAAPGSKAPGSDDDI